MNSATKVWDMIHDIGKGAQRAERKPKRVYAIKGPNGTREVARRLSKAKRVESAADDARLTK